jgi:hypothetical protein
MQPEAVREVRDENNIVIDKIYNPSVGRYDVVVATGPGYLSQRQEAMDAMAQILQGNPNTLDCGRRLVCKEHGLAWGARDGRAL